MQSVKIEFLEKNNYLLKLAEKAQENFPDELCDYIVNEYELQAMVLFRIVDDGTLSVLGKSASAKKNFLRGASFTCTRCKALSHNEPVHNFYTDAECELQISEYLIYEICNTFRINDNTSGFVKFARKTPFSRAEIDSLRVLSGFLSNLLRFWSDARGGNVQVCTNSTSEVLNNISQEIRTPANSIIGFASLLGEDNLTSSQAEYVSTIKNNAHSLLLILNDLIDFARIDSGKVKELRNQIEIKLFLEDVFKVYKDKLDRKNVGYSIEIDKTLPPRVVLDNQKFRYILLNILGHCVKFTDQGKITVRVQPVGTSQLNIKICDTGQGIPSEKLKNLFEPFSFNGDFGKNGNYGLGLTLAKKYINLLGGEIIVDSSIGRGTTFNFTINAEIISELEQKIIGLPAPNINEKMNKVLVIEDDYATSKLLSNYLNKWGYEPTIVNTEEQTMSLIEKDRFLAVIMDIALPNANGLELLKKIRESRNTRNTPVIVCSVEAEQQKAFMLGAVEYFVKPIKYKFLVEVLQSYRLKKDSNVLCVDDDLPTLNLLKEAIESVGYTAVAENISANVMNRIESKDIDLAIIDLDMPYPNGFELIKMIKSNSRFAKLPIIIYTGKENFSEDLKNIDGMFEELISKKSTNIEDLADLINQMINRYDTPPPPQEITAKKDVIKILLAEDYKHSQIIVTRLLKKNNFENIIVVENGEEALDACKKQKFDLVLMDMQMPVMNGFEATEKIRELSGYKNTPVIALTAFAMKGDREKCLEAGATDYIPKPIDSKEFIEKVKHYTTVQK